ncbi:MAG: hypothetical protein KJ674_05855, partial [Nanoarchaeota archaeon]|nr:hypothetical protein [Nanoarchaeota archaeon]
SSVFKFYLFIDFFQENSIFYLFYFLPSTQDCYVVSSNSYGYGGTAARIKKSWQQLWGTTTQQAQGLLDYQ